MKKIGLSVCYDTKNFGSQLQVLATDIKIKSLGFDTEIIVYKKRISPVFIYHSIPRLFNPYFINGKITKIKKKRKLSANQDIKQLIATRNGRFDKFVNETFTNLSKPYYGWSALKEGAKSNYDAFLCGSDQLWLPSNLGSHFYTLEFAPDNKPKIAYATSFGVGQIPWYQKGKTKYFLSRFSSLSSREVRGSELVRELVGFDIPVVCDPTLLLSTSEWEKVIPNNVVIDEKYVFCYFLGTNSEHRELANDLKKKTGYKIVTIPFLDNFVDSDQHFGDYKLFDIDTYDFVNLIRNAEYVLTDSFHGSIFSILSHKKFTIFNRFEEGSKNSRNSRIDSLCSILELNNRRFNYSNEILEQINEDIDYCKVDKCLKNLRDESISYLKGSL